jgi:hypothetical protein
MTDLSKIPTKTINTLAFVICIITFVTLGTLILSFQSDRPFKIYGKEFGFGAEELQKKSNELMDIKNQLSTVKNENLYLKDAYEKLSTELQSRKKQEAALWFPIDDIQFENDGQYKTTDGKRQGLGKWSNSDSELTLRSVAATREEITLETNLQPPSNKIRLHISQPILVPMNKWEYRLSMTYDASFQKIIRVERRNKSMN